MGEILEEKYELLKVIGKGGMSVVYLAMDTRLNRNWAVKEVRKAGNGIKDDIVIASILAEANLIKSLDHPALPRIVDIIEKEEAIYIVMDYIEGESLDKILRKTGPATEEQVIDWGMQVCDILSYLHTHNPPIIYRDIKPANLMLKPNGRICIIDFGIAAEFEDIKAGNTQNLGTKGYAPPEQYEGLTDGRSDIYALGMTMHQLLTGVDPGSRTGYAPVREWNPAISEGMEAIIDKCTEAEPERRYQTSDELCVALSDPSRVTHAWRRRLKKKVAAFAVTAAVFVLSLGTGAACSAKAVSINDNDYAVKVSTGEPESFYEALEIYPGRPEAYAGLVGYYSDHLVVNKELSRLGNTVMKNAGDIGSATPEAASVYYDTGRLIFTEWKGSLKAKSAAAGTLFSKAAENKGYEKMKLAECYTGICSFMTEQGRVSEHSAKEYRDLLKMMEDSMDLAETRNDRDSNYDRISLYCTISDFIDSQAVYMNALDISKDEVESLYLRAHEGAESINSTLSYVIRIQEKMKKGELL